MNQEFAIESFISFCDDMMIAEEGFLSTIKTKLKKFLLTIVRFIEKRVRRIKNIKIRKFLLSKITRLKQLLGEVDEITPENMESKSSEIQEEANDIKEEVEKIVGEDDDYCEQDMHNVDDDENITVLRNNRAGKNNYFYKVKINNEEKYLEAYNLLLKACKATTFNEYIKYWKEFKRVIKLPEKCTVYAMMPSKKYCIFDMYYILENNRPMKRNIKDVLYHTSKDPNLVAITPRWRAEDTDEIIDEDDPIPSWYGRFFDTPRAFFGTYPMTRMGMHSRKVDPNLTIYKAEGITQAYIDTDGITYGKSVYVEGTLPIKLTKVTFNENGKYEEDINALRNDPKYKNVPDDVFQIVVKLDAIKAKEFIMSELDKINTDPNRRSENAKKWKDFRKKFRCIDSFFKKENVKLFDGPGRLHGTPVFGPELRDYFTRFKMLVRQSFTEGEMKMIISLGSNIFIQNSDLKTREDIEAEATAYNDDLY